MHVFLDESGDLGFDFKNKSPSKFFIITILISNDFPPVSRAVKRTLKRKLNHNKTSRRVNELKGTSTSHNVKKYFYDQISNYNDWTLHAIILDKTTLPVGHNYSEKTADLYNLLAKNVLEGVFIPKSETDIQIHVDRSKTNEGVKIFDSLISSYIKPGIADNCSLRIGHFKSQEDFGLQAVDLFCYGISRKYEHQDKKWYELFQNKIKVEAIFRN